MLPLTSSILISVHLLYKIMFGKILEKATYIKAKITKDQLQIALAEATTEDNWQASTTVLHEIASAAYSHEKWKRISEFIWDKMKNSNNWKKILKCLNIVEFLLKNGPQFSCQELKYQLRFFQTLESFRQYEGSQDRGAPIRERAKSIVELLQDDQMLQDQRLRAHQIRQKMSHITGGSTNFSNSYGGKPSAGPKYESYNSETFTKTQDTKGYYNYGGGNYGDRYEDKKFDHDYFENAYREPSPQKPKSNPNIPDHEPAPNQVNKPTPVVETVQKPPTKTKFASITESLMKKGTKPKVQEVKISNDNGIVKPDLSYKKKDPDLFDMEEAFMENRYHFDTEQPQKQQNETRKVLPQKQYQAPSRPVSQPPASSQPNLLGDLDSIAFFGAPSQPTQPEKPPVQQPQSQSQPVQTPPQNQVPSLQPSQPSQLPHFNQLTHSVPTPHPTSINPYIGHPSGYNQLPYNSYNQFNTFNSFGPNYYNPSHPPVYSPPAMNPHYPIIPPTYPPHQPTYNVPPTQPPVNPYANYQKNTNQISLGTATFGSETTKTEEKQNKTSNQNGMGNLTDLSDIMNDINQTKKEAPKKANGSNQEFSNNIKFDQWAW